MTRSQQLTVAAALCAALLGSGCGLAHRRNIIHLDNCNEPINAVHEAFPVNDVSSDAPRDVRINTVRQWDDRYNNGVPLLEKCTYWNQVATTNNQNVAKTEQADADTSLTQINAGLNVAAKAGGVFVNTAIGINQIFGSKADQKIADSQADIGRAALINANKPPMKPMEINVTATGTGGAGGEASATGGSATATGGSATANADANALADAKAKADANANPMVNQTINMPQNPMPMMTPGMPHPD